MNSRGRANRCLLNGFPEGESSCQDAGAKRSDMAKDECESEQLNAENSAHTETNDDQEGLIKKLSIEEVTEKYQDVKNSGSTGVPFQPQIVSQNTSDNEGGQPPFGGSILREPSSFGEDREFEFLKAPPLPRSTSLKTKNTPPGTPVRRKSVRFADALGLDLALIRHILNPDEPPTVPPNAVKFLQTDSTVDRSLETNWTTERPLAVSYWRVCFPQPIINQDLVSQILDKKVMLENCAISGSNRKVYGIVRVANVSYKKEVWVRFTANGWLTCAEERASYIEHSNDLLTDRFSFALNIPDHLGPRSRMEFAVKFTTGNEEFWDNNFDRNYALECVEYL